jgi:hypothetical protein
LAAKFRVAAFSRFPRELPYTTDLQTLIEGLGLACALHLSLA